MPTCKLHPLTISNINGVAFYALINDVTHNESASKTGKEQGDDSLQGILVGHKSTLRSKLPFINQCQNGVERQSLLGKERPTHLEAPMETKSVAQWINLFIQPDVF